jgi:hypothetical protein
VTASCSRETARRCRRPTSPHWSAEKRAIIDKYHYLFPRTGGYCRYKNISNLQSGGFQSSCRGIRPRTRPHPKRCRRRLRWAGTRTKSGAPAFFCRDSRDRAASRRASRRSRSCHDCSIRSLLAAYLASPERRTVTPGSDHPRARLRFRSYARKSVTIGPPPERLTS